MMSFASLLLVGILFSATQAKQFTKCELSQVLKSMDGYKGVTLPECEFPAASLSSTASLPYPPFPSLFFTFIELSNNPLILSAYLFTLLLHLFSCFSFLPLFDPF